MKSKKWGLPGFKYILVGMTRRTGVGSVGWTATDVDTGATLCQYWPFVGSHQGPVPDYIMAWCIPLENYMAIERIK